MAERVIYLVRSWPRLSQTFIVNEILALERRGLELAVFSLVRSGEQVVQPQVAEVRAPVTYLDDAGPAGRGRVARHHLGALAAAPARYLRTLLFCLRRPGLAAGYGECSTLSCFTHAVRVSAVLRGMPGVGDRAVRVHAHFAHDPALVGLLVAKLTGLPYSFTSHARDLLQIPAASLAARASAATALVTCCAANADYIASAVPRRSLPPVSVIHHGVELGRFAFSSHRTDAAPVREPRLVSVGRLVEKKGFADLLRALARLVDEGEEFSFRLYGEGPLRAELTALRDALGLADRVELAGPASSDQIVAALDAADVFVLTPQVTADGDRDGIPNVLVEAMACGLPVVTTSAGGITELVRDDVNGLVRAPGDVAAIAEALRRLLRDRPLRARLATVARRTVEDDYDVDVAARRLEDLLRAPALAGSGAVG